MDQMFSKWQPTALSLFRFITGLLLLQFGIAKIFKFPALPYFASPPPLIMTAGAIELVLGALLMIGLFTRISAFILAGEVTLIPEAISSSVKGGHLKTVVPTVPDAPIGHFRLTLFGGKQGYLTNTRELCSAPAVTTVEYSAQNGKKLTQKVAAKTACAAKAEKSKRQGH